MKLRPLQRLALRREKVLKHYYREVERWWELSEQPESDWREQCSQLRESIHRGAAREEPTDGIVCREAARVLDDGHTRWFGTTERECDDATEYPHQDPRRRHLISEHGVVVVIVPRPTENILVTAFRPDPITPDTAGFVRAAQSYVKRCAIRRVHRRTSYQK